MLIKECSLSVVRELCQKYHGYSSVGNVAVYSWAVYEEDKPVAAYTWLPPAPGAAKSVCPEVPGSVLSLSRMVAVPKAERRLKHVSKPLIKQMKNLIDRTRYPVLVTYSDEGQGHTGYVYACSGWTPTTRKKVPFFENDQGERASVYSGGKTGGRDLHKKGYTWIQRWEHWVCPKDEVFSYMQKHGWTRVPYNAVYQSGNQAYKWVKEA